MGDKYRKSGHKSKNKETQVRTTRQAHQWQLHVHHRMWTLKFLLFNDTTCRTQENLDKKIKNNNKKGITQVKIDLW